MAYIASIRLNQPAAGLSTCLGVKHQRINRRRESLMAKSRLALALMATILSIPVMADETHSHDHHAALGEIGKAPFPSTCTKAAQTQIDRGVALIHSFWYAEAEKAFRKAAEVDPKCGTAWWGVAMSNYHPLWAPPTPSELTTGKEAAEKAKSLGAKSAREKDFIAAVGAYYHQSDTLDHRTRAVAYEKAMEKVAST